MPTVPLLASVADLSASVTSQSASQLVPSGVVMAFAGATAPNGWLLCAGALISRTTYADLFAAIGTAHGSGDGSTTFALPNYAGQFLRGRANGSANDPDRSTRTAAASGGNTGDAVGSLQTGIIQQTNVVAVAGASVGNKTFTTLEVNDDSYATTAASGTELLRFSFVNIANDKRNNDTNYTRTIRAGTGAETRPLNAYVNYIIKI